MFVVLFAGLIARLGGNEAELSKFAFVESGGEIDGGGVLEGDV